MTTEGKKHISNSQLELYWKCGEAYRRRYCENDKTPPGVALLIGSGVHTGAEVNFKQKVDSFRDLPASDIVDVAVAGFDQRLSVDGYSLSKEDESIGVQKSLGKARDTVAALAELHADEQAQDYQPRDVEKATTILLPTCSRDLVAITDLRDVDGRVIDLKTAARKPNADEADRSLQLTIVAAAYKVDYGNECKDVRLDVLTKTKEPQRHVMISQRDDSDYLALASRINVTVAAIEAGSFTPASPSHWACSSKWCGYFRTCPYVNPRRTS